eukprot:3446189-Pyramimonas_sp.AAC.1
MTKKQWTSVGCPPWTRELKQIERLSSFVEGDVVREFVPPPPPCDGRLAIIPLATIHACTDSGGDEAAAKASIAREIADDLF